MSAITARGACRRRGRNGKRFLFRHLRHRDIGLAIVVEVRDHDLVASAEVGGDGVLDEGGGRPGRQERKCQKDGQTAHALQYTFLFSLESKSLGRSSH